MNTATEPTKRKIIRIKKPASEPMAQTAAADTSINNDTQPDIYDILKHNRTYRNVLRELRNKTRFLIWVQKFDLVMLEFLEKAPAYIEHQAAKQEIVATGTKKIIRRKKTNV